MTATTHAIRKPAKEAVLVSNDKLPIRFIKRQTIESMTGISCIEIYSRIAADNLWKQVMLGPKRVVCVEAEIYTWINERIAESRAVA